MSSWIYPANTKMYDVLGAFEKNKVVWPINSKVDVGDTVYIYLSAPYKKVAYRSLVSEIEVSEKLIEKHTKSFFKEDKPSPPSGKKFMMLEEIKSLMSDESELSYENLKLNGLNGMLMGPRKLENNPPLLEYISWHANRI